MWQRDLGAAGVLPAEPSLEGGCGLVDEPLRDLREDAFGHACRRARSGLHPIGWEDDTHWQRTDGAIVTRINRLIEDALRDPTAGIGKPEPLRHLLSGTWSRRISEERRLVYLVDGDDLVILQALYHYR